MRALLAVAAFLLLSNTVHAAPKPLGTITLLNQPGPQAELQYHVERRPQQPNLIVKCGDWFTEQLLGRGVMDATVTVGLPGRATQCQSFALDEGAPNGKDPTLITEVLFFDVVAPAAVQLTTLPDLTLVPEDTEADWFIEERFFAADDCAVLEGLAQPGLRKLLLFTTTILNKGDGPLHIGQISQSPLAYFDNCHQHWHLRDFAEYRLLERRGSKAPLVVSAKQGFCPWDYRLMSRVQGKWVNAPIDDPRWATQTYQGCDDFSEAGISPSFADSYGSQIVGQWLDVTDIPVGTYVLELAVNPVGVFAESNPRNNTINVTVTIP